MVRMHCCAPRVLDAMEKAISTDIIWSDGYRATFQNYRMRFGFRSGLQIRAKFAHCIARFKKIQLADGEALRYYLIFLCPPSRWPLAPPTTNHLAQVSSYYLSGLWYRLPLLPACCPERSDGTLHGAAAPAESSSLSSSMRVASRARSYRARVGDGRLHVDRVEHMGGKRP